MLVNLGYVLDAAQKGGFAVPAFNTYNMETTMGIINAASRLRSPVIIQVYSRLFTNDKAYYLSPVILAAAERADIPVCFHLDHGAGEHEVARALRYGATGIMIDRSRCPIDTNIADTRRIVDICRTLGVGVEGEIGHIGSAASGDEQSCEYTTVDEAVRFVGETEVNALAIAVGTAHGHYKKAPRLAVERIAEIHAAVGAALVLHGGSGIPDSEIRAAIKAGIRKINFGTDLCCAYLNEVFAVPRDKVAVDLFMDSPCEAVAGFAAEKISLLGAEGKA